MSSKPKRRPSTAPAHPYTLIPLILLLLVLPAVSYLHVYDPGLSGYSWYPDTNQAYDLFLYSKSILFIVISVIMLFQVVFRSIRDGRFTAPKIFLPLAIYAALVLLSCVFSQYRDFAFNGGYEQFESFWVLLGYCITAYYAYLMVQNENDLRLLMRFFAAGVAISVLIGLSQAIGHNFWFTSLGKLLRIPADLRNSVKISAAFESTRVYMSLYNPNYVGLYAALTAPILLSLVFPQNYPGTKKSAHAIRLALLALLLAGLACCLAKSEAKNGFLALGISMVFLAFFLLLRDRRHWYFSLAAFALLIVLFFLGDAVTGHKITNSLKNIVSSGQTAYDLQDMEFDGDSVTVTYKGNPLTITLLADSNFHILDSDGNAIEMENANGLDMQLMDPRFYPLSITFAAVDDNRLCIGLKYQDSTWFFGNNGQGLQYYSPVGKWCTFKAAPSAFPAKYESFFTNRGYIWSRTIPLLKKYVLLGSGADTFTLVFPNDDFIGKYNNGFLAQTVTKPHCMYLQVSVQTGILSLVAMLAFYLWYFFSSCRIYFTRKLDSYPARVGLGIFIGTIGYMASAIVNDSTITVAPLFWAMMGTGICINQKLLKGQEPREASIKAANV